MSGKVDRSPSPPPPPPNASDFSCTPGGPWSKYPVNRATRAWRETCALGSAPKSHAKRLGGKRKHHVGLPGPFVVDLFEGAPPPVLFWVVWFGFPPKKKEMQAPQPRLLWFVGFGLVPHPAYCGLLGLDSLSPPLPPPPLETCFILLLLL